MPDQQTRVLAAELANRDRQFRRVSTGLAALGIVVLLLFGVVGLLFWQAYLRDGDTEDKAQVAQERAELTEDQVTALERRLTNRIQIALLRSDETLRCLTKAREPAKCLDIAAGRPGRQGGIGRQGRPGNQGIRGQRGQRGEKGERGDTGPRGDTGAQGPQGDTGPRGERGEQGPPAEKGDRGEQGERGLGYDCAGNLVIPGQAVSTCPGPTGPPGPQGPPGPATCPATAVITQQDGSQVTVCVPA